MSRRYKIPNRFSALYAVRTAGGWVSTNSLDYAKTRAKGANVLLRGSDGYGTVIPESATRPYGNRSGKHVAKRRMIGGTEEQWAELQRRATTAGMPCGAYFWAQLGLD